MSAENDKQPAIKKHFTHEELMAMPAEELLELIGGLPTGAKVKFKAVVKRADGSIKYDNPDLAGTYNEI